MGYTENLLTSVRTQIDAHSEALAEARTRTRLVRDLAQRNTYGALRTYGSGSLSQHTQNHPINDGDAGLVLNRVYYPKLGPEGGGERPDEVVSALCSLLGPAVRETYPSGKCGNSKRGPKINFGSPIDGQDPSVDIIVALTRKDGPGLWIPNLERGTWEASHPEQHTKLLNTEPRSLRTTRRKVIRLLKAWNKQFAVPAFSSFHLSVLALEFVEQGQGTAKALLTVFEKTAARTAKHEATKDPAGVSANIKLLGDWNAARLRMEAAAHNLRDALEHDDDETVVRKALAKLFHKYIDAPDELSSLVTVLQSRTTVVTSALGLGGAGLVVATRAYGHHEYLSSEPSERG